MTTGQMSRYRTGQIMNSQQLREQCHKICLNPVGFRRRLELSDDLRSCAYGNYVIFFESTEDQVTIIRILHGARDIPQEFDPS
jgi:toxin ParE1/3/4